jgi:hypothetical protein
MAETLDEVTYDYEEDGTLVRKEIERVVLTQGAWPTMMVLFQELDRKTGKFRSPKIAIVKFQKSRGGYRRLSSFNITDEEQARRMMTVLEDWCPRLHTTAEDAEDADTGTTDEDRGWGKRRDADRDETASDPGENGGGIS